MAVEAMAVRSVFDDSEEDDGGDGDEGDCDDVCLAMLVFCVETQHDPEGTFQASVLRWCSPCTTPPLALAIFTFCIKIPSMLSVLLPESNY